ncbi:MAG: glycine cleavage system aminomethyltransferase GcvT [Gemmatimonadota bacterium]
MADTKKTPLYEEHVGLGARLVPFAGYAMPVQYAAGIRAEHAAVRSAAGLFDVSHMGEFLVTGPDALEFVSAVTTNDPAALTPGKQAQYSVFCHSDGGIVDDLIVYRLEDERFRLVVNAANLQKDWDHISAAAESFDVQLSDESDALALVALQGPATEQILAPLVSVDLTEIGFYEFLPGEVLGASGVISRTGYTGEDGFELYVPAAAAVSVWRGLLDAGASHGLVPAGLGARDTLRLEMGYALYGNDIDDGTSPLEAGLGWLVKLGKGSFIGSEALSRQKEEGLQRRLRGFRLLERGFPRPGYEVSFDGQSAGKVRSGTMSPSLEVGIGTAYLPPAAKFGDPVTIHIRDREIGGEVVRFPFYSEGSLRR